MKKDEVSRLADIKFTEVVVQQVVVNNKVQNIMDKAFVVSCPECGRVIYQFPIGVSEASAYIARNYGSDELLKIATYCPTCGTKLCYGGETLEEEELNK